MGGGGSGRVGWGGGVHVGRFGVVGGGVQVGIGGGGAPLTSPCPPSNHTITLNLNLTFAADSGMPAMLIGLNKIPPFSWRQSCSTRDSGTSTRPLEYSLPSSSVSPLGHCFFFALCIPALPLGC